MRALKRGAARVVHVFRDATRERHRSAPRVSRRSPSANDGGSTTTRCSARCTTSTGPATGATGSPSCAIATPARSTARAQRLPHASSITSTCSGSPMTQWRRARRDCGGDRHLRRLSRSWSAATAPTSGRGSTSSGIDASVGVPPDAFSETGQDWGLPVYRWDAIRQDDYEWLRQRARRCTELYDGFRVDHLVGFYRTFVREPTAASTSRPPTSRRSWRRANGSSAIFRERGARIIAEDLGVVPDFVRESLARLHSPRAEGAALGARLAHARASRSGGRPTIPPNRSPSAARTTPTRWRSGGTAPSGASASCAPRFPGCATPGAIPTRRSTPACAMRCRSRCSAPARTS